MNEKITPLHLQRKAMLYIRQSSAHQVMHHQESRRLQYAMKERLQQLGWSEIETIDEDQGRSASGLVAREGFQRMVAEVSLGRVGAVAARELSRLSRNHRDWQQLVEVCRIVDTLLIDQETIYDSRRSNDRLLLGLKGSMNEYELDLLRQRAWEARQEKARRGELLVTPPVGFIHGEGSYEKDPDQRVHEAIALLVAKFLEMGSLRQVLLWMMEHELQMPTRRFDSGVWRIHWRRPNYAALYRILIHPIYAGAYVYGQAQTEMVWDGVRARKRSCWKGFEGARVLLIDQHEGYISWPEFERIQRMLTDNCTQFKERESRGAVRRGRALLAGLLRCRRCGRKLVVHYTGRQGDVLRYGCCRGSLDKAEPRCINFGGALVDEAVSREVLRVLQPAAIEAARQSGQEQSQRQDEVLRVLELELKAARYAAGRAGSQYDAADPENRLVTDELERRWNQALERVAEVEARITSERSQGEVPSLPSSEELVALAKDVAGVWNDPETDVRLKKRIVRTLLQEVLVDVCPEAGEIRLVLHWQGDVHTELTVRRRRRGQNRLHTAASTVTAVQLLSRIGSDEQIAGWLNHHQLRTGKGNFWTKSLVASLRSKRAFPAFSVARRKAEGWMTLKAAAAYLGISNTTLRYAAEANDIPALHPLPLGPWIFRRDDLETPTAKQVVQRARRRREGAEPDARQLVLCSSTT
jgi:DNA invertase Pin-like site-specific DNA recombinase